MLKKEDLKELIYKGASLDKQLNNIAINSGYMVSLIGYERTFTPTQIDAIYDAIIEYQKRISNNEYIGLWYNDGLVYVDISKRYTSKQKAVITGVKNRQYTIYDLKNKKDIDLMKTTYIVYRFNKVNKDIQYIKEYYNIKDIVKDYGLKNDRSVQHYIYKSIEDIEANTIEFIDDLDNTEDVDITLLNDKYLIIKDAIYLRDYYELLEA
ncbi:MAG: hypothetical protein J6T15_03820 [Bacilli bacterium]|nr:hypothetical protein [Bacilli bacterium]